MSAFVLTMALSASAWAQPPVPQPHPEPRPAVAKVDRTPAPLTPVETVWGLALEQHADPAAGLRRPPGVHPHRRRSARRVRPDHRHPEMDGDRASRAGAGRGRTDSSSSARPARSERCTRATDRSPGSCRSPTNSPSIRSGTTAGSIVALASGEVRALRATDGRGHLDPRSEISRSRRAGAGGRPRLRPHHRRPHRRAARRQRRAGLGASSRRRDRTRSSRSTIGSTPDRRTTGSTA